MHPEQIAIEVPETLAPATHHCQWCGAPATAIIEVEPPIWGQDRVHKTKVLKRHAIEAHACPSCYRRLVRQPAPSS